MKKVLVPVRENGVNFDVVVRIVRPSRLRLWSVAIALCLWLAALGELMLRVMMVVGE